MTNYIKASLYTRKTEQVQYNACLATTGAFKGTSRECLIKNRTRVAQRQKMELENVFLLQNCEMTFA